MPHFLAIAWLYRDDYARPGIPLLPVLEPDGRRTGQQALLYAAALWPVSLMPAVVGLAGLALQRRRHRCSGSASSGSALRFARDRSMADGAPAVPVLDHLPAAAARRARRRPSLDLIVPMEISDLPALNATLNALAAVFLTVGYVLIRAGRQRAHKRCMLAALTTSALFLASLRHLSRQRRVAPLPGTGRHPRRLLRHPDHRTSSWRRRSCRWRW